MAKTATPASMGAAPADLDAHNADMERRIAESKAAHRRLLDCLDPTVAKSYEDRKDLYEWQVQVKLFRPSIGRQHAHMEDFTRNVVAQNQQDAWAMFCDSIGEWPSPRDASPTITRQKKRTLRAESED